MSYQVYGKYKNLRNASWQCLIEHQIQSLPVSVLKIAKESGIKAVKNSEVYELSPSERGLSMFEDNQWYIIYDDEDILPKQRFTIAHELGHIFLGHEIKRYRIDERAEMEADMFALRLLAPACVLWTLELHSKDEIAKVCDICNNSAHKRAERMKVLYERNKFLESALEKKVFEQFSDFIKGHKKPR